MIGQLLIGAIHHDSAMLGTVRIAYNRYYVNHQKHGGADASFQGAKWSEGNSGHVAPEAGRGADLSGVLIPGEGGGGRFRPGLGKRIPLPWVRNIFSKVG